MRRIEKAPSIPAHRLETDKQSVVVEILCREMTENYPALEDDALALAADQVFLDLDRREGSDESSPTL